MGAFAGQARRELLATGETARKRTVPAARKGTVPAARKRTVPAARSAGASDVLIAQETGFLLAPASGPDPRWQHIQQRGLSRKVMMLRWLVTTTMQHTSAVPAAPQARRSGKAGPDEDRSHPGNP